MTAPISRPARLRRSLRRARRPLIALLALPATAISISACGTQGIQLSKSNPYYSGAVIFRDHCSGCHTLSVVGAEGSATSVQDRVKTDGPNFNVRKETIKQVLYALHNGGFSGEIMPENVVVGPQAQKVAEFLAKYSGLKAEKETAPGGK